MTLHYQAAVLQRPRSPLQIETVAAAPLAPSDVLVRVRAAGLCHTDLEVIDGSLRYPMPIVLGHEAAGVVADVGPAVRQLKAGDHVILSWNPHCGHCYYCDRGLPILCEDYLAKGPMAVGFDGTCKARRASGEELKHLMFLGAFGEYCIVPEQQAIAVSRDIPFDRACLIGCGVMTGVGAVINTAQVEPGASVAVIGCGGVGISAIQGARLSGAAVIVGVDPVEGKHALARRFGATHAVHPDNLSELSAELTGGEGFDYAFEVVGAPQTIRSAWGAARRGGTVVIVGAGRADQQVEFTPFELLFDGKKMLSSLYGEADVRRDYARLLGLWRAGRLDLEGMITHRLKLDDLDQGLAALGQGDVIRQVIIHD